MRTSLLIVVALTGLATLQTAYADPSDGVSIPARLDCGPLTPKRANDSAFTSPMDIIYKEGKLSATRQRISDNGVERFVGTIDPLGRMELGAKYGDKQSYIFKLRGQLSDKGPTILMGGVEILSGSIGHRLCTVTLLQKPNELMAAFSR